MNGIDAMTTLQGFGDLLDAITVGIEQHDFKLPVALSASVKVIYECLMIPDLTIDEYDLLGPGQCIADGIGVAGCIYLNISKIIGRCAFVIGGVVRDHGTDVGNLGGGDRDRRCRVDAACVDFRAGFGLSLDVAGRVFNRHLIRSRNLVQTRHDIGGEQHTLLQLFVVEDLGLFFRSFLLHSQL